jgi:hypothetical protein
MAPDRLSRLVGLCVVDLAGARWLTESKQGPSPRVNCSSSNTRAGALEAPSVPVLTP